MAINLARASVREKMSTATLWRVVFVLLLYWLGEQIVHCSIVSQSSISSCRAGDTKDPKQKDGGACTNKMIVSLTLSGDQGETETLYADIDKVFEEGATEFSRLRKPLRIEISKSKVTASYRVNYLGSVNAKPKEVYFRKANCNDDWYARNSSLACSKQIGSDGEDVWDSQGFCCKCTSTFFRGAQNVRGDHNCPAIFAYINKWSTAHCMQNDELWYNVYDIDTPMMQYRITVRVLEFKGILRNGTTNSLQADWEQMSTFQLSPERTISRSSDGRVIAEIEGDLRGAKGLRDFSYKNLLVPSLANWKNRTIPPPQYKNGPSDWILVDKHMVDLSGRVCSKVGVSYTGFRNQPGKCNREAHSCFTNQPLDLWNHDTMLKKENKSGLYLLSNFGQADESIRSSNSSFILRLVHEDLHNTFVTMRLDASDIVFVYSVGSGRITDVYAQDFEALVGRGRIYVEVENTGDITADFSVSILKCTRGVHTVSARTTTIDPGKSKEISFRVQSYTAQGAENECDVELYDSDYNLLQTASVNFLTNSTCFCFGSCGCSCNSSMPVECPNPPPVTYERSPLIIRIIFLVLEVIGLHGFVGVLGGTFIILGFIKLSFGGILFCRKTKSQKFAEELKKQGLVNDKSPQLVQCSADCSGAEAAKARYERKIKRLKKLGRKPNKRDDWRNYSYTCTCQNDLADIRYIEVLKSIFFIYYWMIFPCVWIGKKVVWGIFRDTAKQKKNAIRRVLANAKKKGNLAKYDYIESQTDDTKDKSRKGKKESDTSLKRKRKNKKKSSSKESTLSQEQINKTEGTRRKSKTPAKQDQLSSSDNEKSDVSVELMVTNSSSNRRQHSESESAGSQSESTGQSSGSNASQYTSDSS